MTSFTFYVYNKRQKVNHYLLKNYETNDLEEAKKMLSESSDGWRYDILDVEIHKQEEHVWYDGDLETSQVVKKTSVW